MKYFDDNPIMNMIISILATIFILLFVVVVVKPDNDVMVFIFVFFALVNYFTYYFTVHKKSK